MTQKVVLVSPNCPSCQVIKKLLTKMGKIDEYKILDVSTAEGMFLAEKLGVTAIPDCIIVEGDYARRCTEKEFKEILSTKGDI